MANSWRITPDIIEAQTSPGRHWWVDMIISNDMPNWVWRSDNSIQVLNHGWWEENYDDVKQWLIEQELSTHITFQGSEKIHIKNITPEFKTLFTLRWR